MSPRERDRFSVAACLAVVAWLSIGSLGAQELTELTATHAASGRVPVLVELTAEPAALLYGQLLQRVGARRAQAMPEAIQAAKTHIEAIKADQERVGTALRLRFDVQEIYRVQRALNAIAILVDPRRLDEIRRLAGVKSVRILQPEYPTTSTSVPFLGTPQLWGDTLGLGRSLKGTGITIGIIDSGIDYQHADFGGTGLLADYQANDRTTIADGSPVPFFPTAKVVGGTDFAGDAYNGGNAPVPDPDPMDCLGHGTHVAGIAAGYGVNADGTTYAGPFDGTAPFASLRKGPGMAPLASLYSLRVFGCSGSTSLTVQAIDWAIDPNGDGDFSDHLDVINMSLGSSFGGPDSATALASDNAAIAGVIVVASAGNSGDTYFITGSPASAGRVVSVAASVDDGVPGAFLQVNSPAGIAGSYAAQPAAFTDPTPPAPPAPSGQTGDVVLATPNNGCTAFTNAAAVAGKVALVDRGSCSFSVKLDNANAAGAIGLIVANNVAQDPTLITMAGAATAEVNFPSVFISQADGNTIKAQLGTGVNVTFAAANAGDTLASFSSRGPRRGSNPIILKPDVSAPGLNITSSQTGITCVTGGGCISPSASGFIPDNQTLTISGTSMSCPHIAGEMALLRELHPDWTVEELKALVMNTALASPTRLPNGAGGIFGPGRVGAGRTKAPDAATTDVVALNGEEAGLVSVSFDGEVLGTVARTRKVRVVNNGATPVTYDLGIDAVVDAPGLAFSFPGGTSLTVLAGETVEFDVQMDANAAQMNHTREASVAPVQAAPAPLTGLGALSRHWLTEEAGYITFSQAGILKKRVPVYVAARPASIMEGAATIVTGGAASGSTTLPLSGAAVCTGTLGAGPSCTGTFPTTEVSLVTPFELQVMSPADPVNAPPFADIQYAGVAYSGAANLVMFGVSTWGPWSTPTDVAFNIYIDNNNDGAWDRILFNSNPGTMAASLFGTGGASAQDSFVNGIFNIATNGVSIGGGGLFVNRLSAGSFDSALFNNNVMFLAATPAQLGLAAGTTSFRYKIVTCPGSAPLCQALNGFHYDSAGTDASPFKWNYAAASQGLDFNGTNLAQDLDGTTIPVNWSTANLTANGSFGALLLHHHNIAGRTAQIVPLDGGASADLSITKTDGQATAVPGQGTTYTIVVSNAGPDGATNALVNDVFPPGVTAVAWTCVGSGGGSCAAPTGAGDIHTTVTLPAGSSATFMAVATISSTASGSLVNTATITPPVDGSVNDPVAANNSATDTDVLVPTADLSITKTDGQTTTLPGAALTYTIVVTNAGPSAAPGAVMTDTMPGLLTGVTWTCAATAGSGCGDASGAGSIATTLSLLAGGSATFTVNASLSASAAGTLANTASVAAPGGVTDPNPANNSATDSDPVIACASPILAVPDGRLTDSVIPAGATLWFGATLKIGDSYSVEFKSTAGTTSPGVLTLFSGDDACGPSTLTSTDTSGIEPAGTGGTLRASFRATGTGTLFRARLVNAGASTPLSFSWSDTAMYSPAWSTNGGFDTFYTLENTTGTTLAGTLDLLDAAGAVVGTFPVSAPAGQTVSMNTSALGVARNRTGTARFTHNGPPGAFAVEAAIANFTINPAYVQPVKFVAVRESR